MLGMTIAVIFHLIFLRLEGIGKEIKWKIK